MANEGVLPTKGTFIALMHDGRQQDEIIDHLDEEEWNAMQVAAMQLLPADQQPTEWQYHLRAFVTVLRVSKREAAANQKAIVMPTRRPVDQTFSSTRDAGNALKALLMASEDAVAILGDDFVEALEKMIDRGVVLRDELVSRLQDTDVLGLCLERDDDADKMESQKQLKDLENALMLAADETMNVEIVRLWLMVREALQHNTQDEKKKKKRKNRDSMRNVRDSVHVLTKKVGARLRPLCTPECTSEMKIEVSNDLCEAIVDMANHGTPPSVNMAYELSSHIAEMARYLASKETKAGQHEHHPAEELHTFLQELVHLGQRVYDGMRQALDSYMVTLDHREKKHAMPMLKRILTLKSSRSSLALDLVANNHHDEKYAEIDKIKPAAIADAGCAFVITRDALERAIRKLNTGKDAAEQEDENEASDADDDSGGASKGQNKLNVKKVEPEPSRGVDPKKQQKSNSADDSGGFWGLLSGIDVLRVELFLTFAQTMSLVLSQLYDFEQLSAPTMEFLRTIKDTVLSVVSFKIFAISISLEVMFRICVALLVISVFTYCWLLIYSQTLPDRDSVIRQGHEADVWHTLQSTQHWRLKIFKGLIYSFTFIYLPANQLAIAVLTQRSDENEYIKFLENLIHSSAGMFAFRAFVLGVFVAFSLEFPAFLAKAIRANEPTGTRENPNLIHDMDGKLVPFDDKVYLRLATHDPNQIDCPFRSLYMGFERQHSLYKVNQLYFKLLLVSPTFVKDMWLRSVVMLCFSSFAVWTAITDRPFVNPINDWIDIGGKAATFLAALGGALVPTDKNIPSSEMQWFVGIMVALVLVGNFALHGLAFVMTFPTAKRWVKETLGVFTFSDTVHMVDISFLKPTLRRWDVERECKYRIWHTFWKELLLNRSPSALRRLIHQEKAVIESGIGSVRKHVEGERDPYVARLRMAIRCNLEGVDVYWNDVSGTRDGFLDSKTCFGKLYVTPFPFHCVVVYDDADDESIIRDDDKIEKLLLLNMSPSVLDKRAVRRKLRALSEFGREVKLPEPYTKTFKTRDWGQLRATEFQFTYEYARIEVISAHLQAVQDAKVKAQEAWILKRLYLQFMAFMLCIVSDPIGYLRKKADKLNRLRGAAQASTKAPISAEELVAPGFFVSLESDSGVGVAKGSGVQSKKHKKVSFGPQHLQLTNAMTESPALTTLFDDHYPIIREHRYALERQYAKYRQKLLAKHEAAQKLLSDGFWYHVYNRDNLSREILETYLATHETNKEIRDIPIEAKAELDALYQRMDFVRESPKKMFWFVFWEDFHSQNKDMACVRQHEELFDPRNPNSICFHLLAKEDLRRWLTQVGLLGEYTKWTPARPWSYKRRLFNESNIAFLYERMNDFAISTVARELDQ
ncbi:TPA: hypothetical protein N0F65_004850 [Lagenidium giganteum]|uniref:Uncharacterized protein n=1 Tax=Lagenidium giganteum TaxID=4803 RepID=A0AAV2Z6N7_9STRA|nr:TPA: hypothetical protein N0F65_004850 [Lagenidium giganteum]